jgi:hypothetical protein
MKLLVKWLRPGVGMFLIVLGLASPAYAGYGHSHHGVPEIDPGAIGSAMALLTGGLLMITDRFTRK